MEPEIFHNGSIQVKSLVEVHAIDSLWHARFPTSERCFVYVRSFVIAGRGPAYSGPQR